MNSGRLLLGAYLLLQIGVFEHDGAYSPEALGFLLVSFVLFVSACWLVARRTSQTLPVSDLRLVGGLLLLLFVGSQRAPGYYLEKPEFAEWADISVQLVGGCIALAYLLVPHANRVRTGVFGGAVATAVLLRVGLLWASPSPSVDVFQLAQQGSGYLLKGYNPYTSPVWGNLSDGFQYGFAGHAYPPGALLLEAPMFAITGDARAACLLAEVGFAVSIWLVTRDLAKPTRELGVLLFLFGPRSLFVLENAWTEPLILGVFGLSLVLWQRKRPLLAAAVAGFLFGMKHYLAFAAPQYLVLERRIKPWIVLTGIGMLPFLPFVLWDAEALWKNGILLVVSLGFSDNSLGTASALYRLTGKVTPAFVSVIVGSVAAVSFQWLLRRAAPLARYVLAVTATLFATFLFGAKAFCNYYYLVGGLLLLALLLHATSAEPRATTSSA